MNKRQKYLIVSAFYTEDGMTEILRKCNGITIANTGDVDVIVNNILLYGGDPTTQTMGDSVSIGGNFNEELSESRLVISFRGTVGNTDQEIMVIQKIYID